jgi:hypothetical protein
MISISIDIGQKNLGVLIMKTCFQCINYLTKKSDLKCDCNSIISILHKNTYNLKTTKIFNYSSIYELIAANLNMLYDILGRKFEIDNVFIENQNGLSGLNQMILHYTIFYYTTHKKELTICAPCNKNKCTFGCSLDNYKKLNPLDPKLKSKSTLRSYRYKINKAHCKVNALMFLDALEQYKLNNIDRDSIVEYSNASISKYFGRLTKAHKSIIDVHQADCLLQYLYCIDFTNFC